jgi:hypothetical protein
MIEEIKLLLGEAAANYTDAQIGLAYKLSLAEVEEYCRRDADKTLELMAEQIAVIKLNRSGTQGLASQSFSGVGENFLDGYPAEIVAVLNQKRKIKVVG